VESVPEQGSAFVVCFPSNLLIEAFVPATGT